MIKNRKHITYTIFILLLILNISMWFYHKSMKPIWGNVPESPSQSALLFISLGDKEASYRFYSQILQNMGETGGENRMFSEYNYKNIGQWLTNLHNLSPDSDLIPYVGAYYYGATRDPAQIPYIIDFLRIAGHGGGKQDWRWLVQAIYMSKHIKNDLPLALELAEELSSLYRPDMPAWTLQMPAFISMDLGDKEAAYQLSMEILSYGVDKFEPAEILFIKEYICTRVLGEDGSKVNALCSNKKEP